MTLPVERWQLSRTRPRCRTCGCGRPSRRWAMQRPLSELHSMWRETKKCGRMWQSTRLRMGLPWLTAGPAARRGLGQRGPFLQRWGVRRGCSWRGTNARRGLWQHIDLGAVHLRSAPAHRGTMSRRLSAAISISRAGSDRSPDRYAHSHVLVCQEGTSQGLGH